MMNALKAFWIGVTALSILTAADATYIGKWKMKPKSQPTGKTFSIEKTAAGGMRYSTPEISYDFKPDGKDYPSPNGGVVAWKEIGPDAWEVTVHVNGSVLTTIHILVKGDTLSMMSQGAKRFGGAMEESSTWKRVAGGPGIAGQWKSIESQAAASTVEVAVNGADGLTINFPAYGQVCSGKFDGKSYPLTGPNASAKDACSIKRTGENSFELTQKVDGKAAYVETFTVSADGKTLTDDGSPVHAKEPTKAVYDRQ
jgi:hypothetical protein